MNSKGYTLMELLAVIIILSITGLIVFPIVTDIVSNTAQVAYDRNIEAIKESAGDWALKNTELLPTTGNSILVYLGELKRNTTIDINVKNPKTGKVLSNNTSVTITNVNGKFEYTVNVVEINKNEGDSPILVIDGNIVDFVEVNQEGIPYTIPQVTAKNSNGEIVSDAVVDYQILKDGNVVSKIDTSKLGTYTLTYGITYDNKTAHYDKTVVVRDTTPPELEIGDNITCTETTLPTEALLRFGVHATDNSGETIPVDMRSLISTGKGVFYVYYTATDSSNNTVTKRKEVTVN